MATLHDTLIGRRSFYSHKYTDGTGYKLPKSGRSEFNKRWRQRVVTQQDESFRKLYDRFVQEVVVPSLGVECVYYQHLPTFRVAPPGMRALGVKHCDSEYKHQPGEINFWLPLTPVWGSNTLWTETEPGKGDFHPMELDYGQMQRFYGNKCEHYTLANDTDSTRVSLDFRVVPKGWFDPDFSGGGKHVNFKLGQWYLDSSCPEYSAGVGCKTGVDR